VSRRSGPREGGEEETSARSSRSRRVTRNWKAEDFGAEISEFAHADRQNRPKSSEKRSRPDGDCSGVGERRKAMGKVAKDSTGEPIEAPGFEGRYGETEGYTIGFERYTEHADLTPLFVGLPDDKCQSPHWGYVFKGRLVCHTADGTSRSPTARPTT
jgi:hypothetical protein